MKWGRFSPLLLLSCLLAGVADLCNGQLVTRQDAPPGSVGLAWDPSPSAEVVGYNIYYGVGSGVYTNVVKLGNVTNATVSGLVRGVTYFFAATAVARDGLESEFSNEVSYTAPRPPAPPVLRVVAISVEGRLRLGIEGSGWTVYVVEATENVAGEWVALGQVEADEAGRAEFVDLAVMKRRRFYRVGG